jgi:hypothetical protein
MALSTIKFLIGNIGAERVSPDTKCARSGTSPVLKWWWAHFDSTFAAQFVDEDRSELPSY